MLPPPGFEPSVRAEAPKCNPRMRPTELTAEPSEDRRRRPQLNPGGASHEGSSTRCRRPGSNRSVRAEAETCCPRCGPQADRRAERGSPKATAAQSGRRVLVPSSRPAPDWNCLQADAGRRPSVIRCSLLSCVYAIVVRRSEWPTASSTNTALLPSPNHVVMGRCRRSC